MIEFVLFGQIGVVHPATVPFAETLISLWVTYLERPMSSLRASATIAMHRVMVEPRGAGMSMSSSGSHTTCMGLFLSSGCFGFAVSSLFGAERPFFVPSPAIRFPERAEGVKGPKR
jgi:hypothetical protein